VCYADAGPEECNEASQEATNAAGAGSALRRGELKTDCRGERAEGIERSHEIAAGLQEASQTGDQPTAAGKKCDQFDGCEADSFEEIQEVKQCCVGFVWTQSRGKFGHYFKDEQF
jgi:hypothetical protein